MTRVDGSGMQGVGLEPGDWLALAKAGHGDEAGVGASGWAGVADGVDGGGALPGWLVAAWGDGAAQRVDAGASVDEVGEGSERVEEYVPDLGAPEVGVTKKGQREELGRTDLDKSFAGDKNVLRARVEKTAKLLGMDPGLLAATMFAEVSDAKIWTGSHGTVPSEALGLDDWFDPTMAGYIKQVIKEHPGLGFSYGDVKANGASWNTGSEKPGGGWKPRGELAADKAVMAVAVYQMAQEKMLANIIENVRKAHPEWPPLAALPPEQRLTLGRVAMNAGVGRAKKLYVELAKGGDLPRTGDTRRNPKDPVRTAVLHVARAIHLDQVVFGRPAEDYRR